MSLIGAGNPTANAAIRSKPLKLPLWRTAGQAYVLWARNFPELVRTCGLWLLLLAPFIAIDAWWRAPHTAALLRALRHDDPSFDLTPSITALLLSLITLPAAASIAVAWHRSCLETNIQFRDLSAARFRSRRLHIDLRGDLAAGSFRFAGYQAHRGWYGALAYPRCSVSRLLVRHATTIVGVACEGTGAARCHPLRCVAGNQTQYLATVLGVCGLHCPRIRRRQSGVSIAAA